jgi:hypothetical protein
MHVGVGGKGEGGTVVLDLETGKIREFIEVGRDQSSRNRDRAAAIEVRLSSVMG